MHIDGGHLEDEVYKDIMLMKKLATKDTIVFMDDYDAFGITPGLKRARKDGVFRLDRIYEQNNLVGGDWFAESVHERAPKSKTKKWIIGHYKMTDSKVPHYKRTFRWNVEMILKYIQDLFV